MKSALIEPILTWYRKRFKNKMLLAVVSIFVCIYGITLHWVYLQTAASLLNATQQEALSTTGILAMSLYRSYEVENDQREIQSFIVGSQPYRKNLLEINVIDRQKTVVASTNEDNLFQQKKQQEFDLALNNLTHVSRHLDHRPAFIRVIYPISAGPSEVTSNTPGSKHFAVGVIESRFDMSDQLATLEKIRLYTLLAGVLIVLAITFAISRLSQALTRPIESLYLGMSKVDEDNLDVQVEVTTQDEIGFLSHSFNKMIVSLKQSRQRLHKMVAASTRFVPSQFLNLLGKSNITHVALGDAKSQNITVLFMDIRNFTAISRSHDAKKVLRLLNSLNQHLLPCIEKHNGFIDKYIGDAIMAIFPQSSDDALLAAVDMFDGLAKYNQHASRNTLPTIQFGIGINTGDAIIGTVGTNKRMDTTVIGNTVNIASRLEGLSKRFDVPIIFSEDVYKKLTYRSKHELSLEDLGLANVRGLDTSLHIYGIHIAGVVF